VQNDHFRILSLSGGGARGILQAEMLLRYEQELGVPVGTQFDLIVGTSVGGVIGAALAYGISADNINKLFRECVRSIFVSQNFGLKRRPTYSLDPLRERLSKEFGNARISGLSRDIILVTATIDKYQTKLITNIPGLPGSETDISIIDAVCASAAAPTYFSAVKPSGKEQSYVDGGVWANSPSLIGHFVAVHKLNVPPQRVKLVHLGTGTTPTGILRSDYDRLRPFGISTVKAVLELIFACQVDGIEYQLRESIGNERYLSIDPQLKRAIALDDASAALEELPAVAERTFQDYRGKLLDFVPLRKQPYSTEGITLASYEMISASGLKTFVPHRDYYKKFRDGAQSINSYVRRAQHNVTFVSINLLTGTLLESIRRVVEAKLHENPKFVATISLLCPRKKDLMAATAPILNCTGEELSVAIEKTLGQLKLWKSEFSAREKDRFKIRTHNALPFGSAIIIDEDHQGSTIQIETKAYRMPLEESFAFEVVDGSESGLYRSLLEGFRLLMKDGAEEI
jgi:uncharacterized protein